MLARAMLFNERSSLWRFIGALVIVVPLSACSAASLRSVLPSGSSFVAVAKRAVDASASTSETVAATGLAAQVHADGALGYYQLADTGDGVVDTESGKTVGEYGSTVKRDTASIVSDASASATFPGGTSSTADEAVITNATALQSAVSGVTVEAWLSESETNGAGLVTLAAFYGGTAGQPYGLHICGTTIEFDVHPQNGGMTVWGPTLQLNHTYYVVATYNGSAVSLYVDGQLVVTKPTQGQFRYTTSAFSIGGALGVATPGFIGRMNDVAVYGHALTAQQIEEHFLAGSARGLAAETPTAATTFVNSMGVNTHFSQSPYNGPGEARILNYLTASGIRHIRDGSVAVGNFQSTLAKLATEGIHATITTELSETDQEIKAYPATIGGALEAYEGPNEPNFQSSDWTSVTVPFIERLWADVKGDSALAQYPVIAPGIALGSAGALGNMSAYVDYGNTHDYFLENNPETGGFGSVTPQGQYGSLSYNLNLAALISGTKPIMSTETGYGSSPTGGASFVDDATAARYVSRTYFHQYNAGVVRTFIYEFLDENTSAEDFTNFGFLDANVNPKPTYNTIRAIIADLSDSGTPGTLTPLTYELAGNVANLEHTLLEKSDGTYYLALWLAVPSWENNHRVIVQPQTVDIITHLPMKSATVMQLNNNGNASFVNLSGLPGTATSVLVWDSVSIVKLTF